MADAKPDAEWVRKTRQAAGLSQVQLATALQVNQTVVSKIERGSRRLTLGEAAAIAHACGLRDEQWVELRHALEQAPAPAGSAA